MIRAGKYLIIIFIISFVPTYGQYSVRDTIPIKEITVKHQQLAGGKVERIDTLVMKSSANASLAEMLAQHTSVFIKSAGKGTVATASMRGAGASHTKVLWDDMPINSPMTGQVDFSILPVYFSDEISLEYGSAALVNTGGALGGSVLLRNTPDWRKGWNGKLLGGWGSFGTYTTYGNIKWADEKNMVRVRSFYERSENNFKYLNTTHPESERTVERQENAGYFNTGIMAEWVNRLSQKAMLDVNYWHQYSNRNLPKLMSNSAVNHSEKQIDKNNRLKLAYKYYGNNYQLEVSSGLNHSFLNYELKNMPMGYSEYITNIASGSETVSSLSFVKFKRRWENNLRLEATLNTALHWGEMYDEKSGAGFNAQQNQHALVVALHKSFGKKWLFSGIVRQELIDGRFISPIPSLGMEYKLIKHPEGKKEISLKTNFSRNYHHPSLNDLYFIPGGNSDLEPEKGYTGEVGLHAAINARQIQFSSDLNGFYSVIDDWILWYPTQFEYWTPENVQTVHSRGIEYRSKLVWSTQWFKNSTQAKYAYTVTTNESKNLDENNRSKGQQLIYIPRHNASLNNSMVVKGFNLNIMLHYTGKRPTSTVVDEYNPPLESFWLTSVALNKDFIVTNGNQLGFSFKINNLFNVRYQSIKYRAMPGINYLLMLNYAF